MKPKALVTVVLLLFVVASLAWLGVKEIRHSRAVKEVQATPVPPAAAPAKQAIPTAVPAPATAEVPPTAVHAPAVAPPSSPVKDPAPPKAATPTAATTGVAQAAQPVPAKTKVVVYYLHSTARCTNCLKIEAYTASAVTGGFGVPLSDGRLEWKVLNTDEPKNAHFIEDYELFTKSVVVSEVKDGKEARWKRLDKVWDLLDDRQAFEKYVKDEVKVFLGEA
jgi:hypothetical protein